MKTSLHMNLFLICLGIVVSSIGSTGCVPDKNLSYTKAQFSPATIDRVCIVQPIEGRIIVRDSDKLSQIAPKLSSSLESSLKKMGYAVDVAPNGSSLTAEQVAFADSAAIKTLGLADARWVLVPILESANPSAVLISAPYEVTFYLFDKENGELVWEGNGMGGNLGTLPDLVLRSSFQKKQ